ncbi:hypothetical protein HID67_07845, partial [Pasteurella multocida]|uniref:hypothetical protein n=1 Tax=Pasteurella multocida TaxID=747 RepID=UPI0014612F2D
LEGKDGVLEGNKSKGEDNEAERTAKEEAEEKETFKGEQQGKSNKKNVEEIVGIFIGDVRLKG